MGSDYDKDAAVIVPIMRREDQFTDTKTKQFLMASYDGDERAISLVIRFAEITRDKKALSELANDNDPLVRVAVAENSHTPPETVYLLACDPHVDVRYTIAENAHTPPIILRMLMKDENPYIAARSRETLSRTTTKPAQSIEFKTTPSTQQKNFGSA